MANSSLPSKRRLPIVSPGNAADTTGSPNPAGAVGYTYQIGKFEVSEDMIDKSKTPENLIEKVHQAGGTIGRTELDTPEEPIK